MNELAISPATPTTLAPRFSFQELRVISEEVSTSGLFPGVNTPQAALTLMLLCEAEGLHPINALRRFHIIEGRPSMRADAMQAEFQRHGGIIRWGRSDGEVCSARFIHPVHAPDPGVEVTVSLKELVDSGVAMTWDKQKNQSVLKKVYRQFGPSMLRARTVSQGVRMVLPGVVVGIYTPEEVQDFDPPPAIEVTGRVVERVEDDEPATLGAEPLPPSETWSSFASRTLREANDDWKARLTIAGVADDRRKPLTNIHHLTNGVAKRAAEKGVISWSDVEDPSEPGTVISAKAKSRVAELFRTRPKATAKAAIDYLDELRLRAIDDLGMDEQGRPVDEATEEAEASSVAEVASN